MNDIVNSQNKKNGTKTNSENSNSSKNSTKVQPGDQYVVDGAIFKCQYGAAPSQLLVASNQKVMAQGKAIASDKDVTFKIATAPFATCTQNKSPQGPTCIYAKGNFDKSTTVKHGNITALTENSTIMCPIFAGEISCVFPGQTKTVTAADFENVEIKTLSNFPLALVVTFPNFKDNESPKKVANVESVSVSKKLVRINEDITLHAYKQNQQKEELIYPNFNNWVLFTTKQLEENKEEKIKKGTYIDDLKIFRHVSSPFITKLHKPGTYHIEACGEKTLEKYYKLNPNTPLQIVNNKTVPSFYKDCEIIVDVVENNRIVDILMDGKTISEDKTAYIKQGKEAVFSPKFLLDFNSEIDELKVSIKDTKNNADITDCYKLESKDQDIRLTTLVAEKDYTITFSLFKKENGTVKETAISEKSVTLHSYNEAVVFAHVPESSSKNQPSDNVTLKRPQEGLAFTVKVKDDNADLSGVEWRLKKDDKYVNEIVKAKGETALYFFKEEGHYEIVADLTNTNYCNGGVEGSGVTTKGRDVSQRVITHKFEISENYVTALKMALTNGKRYVGVKYTINPEFLFGTDTFACEKKDVVYKADGADENYLRQGIFFATEPGAYTVEAILNGKTKSETFTIEETTFVSWDFCDSNRRRINAIGRDMEFGINGSVPAWALVGDKNSKENTPKRNIYVGLYVKDRMINSFKSEVDCDGNFHVEGIDVEKDVIMNLHSTDNKDNFTLTFKVLGCPTNIVKDLQMSEKKELFADGHNLIVTKDLRIEGYFAHPDGRRIVELMDYDDDVNVHLRILNASQDDLKNYRLRVYENMQGFDPCVFESSELTIDEDGVVDIPVKISMSKKEILAELDSLKFGSELDKLKFPDKKESEETSLPRLFYFMVVKLDAFGIIQNSQYAYIDDFAKKYVYPPCPGDLYNYNAKELETLVDNEKFDLLKYDSEFQKKSKARNYYYQLKLVSKKEKNDYTNTYNKFGLVVVGEDWEKEEKDKNTNTRCFCHRDFTVEEVKSFITALRGKKPSGNIWEDSPYVNDKSISTFTKELNISFKRYGINKCIQKIVFLAMACVETAYFRASEEAPNNYASSKSKFKGRGLLHITHEVHYKTYNGRLSKNVLEYPELISNDIHNIVDSGATFFTNRNFMHNRVLSNNSKVVKKYHECFSIPYMLTLSQLCLFMESDSANEMDYYLLINRLLNNPSKETPLSWEARKTTFETLKKAFNYKKEVCKEVEKDFPIHNTGWHDPLDVMQICAYQFSGGFGAYNASFHQRNDSFHHGVDLFAKLKTPIYACLDGRIVFADVQRGYGNIIILAIYESSQVEIFKKRKRKYTPYYSVEEMEDPNKKFNFDGDIFYLAYAHLDSFTVIDGDEVKAGEVIGYSGETGKAKGTKGPHLHFEVRCEKMSNRCNPSLYFDYEQYMPIAYDQNKIIRIESHSLLKDYGKKATKVEIKHIDGNLSTIEKNEFEVDSNDQYCYKRDKK